jgi:hypothetical protein
MSEKRESSVAAQAKPESGIARVHGTERGDEIYVYVGERGKGGVCVFGSRYGDRPQAERVAHAINSTHERICPYRAERDAAIERACEEWQNLAANKHDELHQLRKANEALREGLRQYGEHDPHCAVVKSRPDLNTREWINGDDRLCNCGLAALLAGDGEAERGD